MTRHIFVLLDSADHAASRAAYIENKVRPGTTVHLLIRSRAQQTNWAIAYLTAASTPRSSAVKACEQLRQSAIEREQQDAEVKTAPLRQALSDGGAKLRVHLYTGSLKKTLNDLIEIHGAPLAVLRLGGEIGWRKLFKLARKSLGLPESMPSPEAELAYRRDL